MQVGIAAVGVGCRQVGLNFYSPLQVIEGAVQVPGSAHTGVNGGPVDQGYGRFRVESYGPVQVSEGLTQIARLVTFHECDGAVDVRGDDLGGYCHRLGQVGDGPGGVAFSAASQVGQAAAVVDVRRAGIDGQSLGEQRNGLIQVGQLAALVGAAKAVPQAGKSHRIHRRLRQGLYKDNLCLIEVLSLQVKLAQGEQRNGAHLVGQVQVDYSGQFRRGGRNVNHALVNGLSLRLRHGQGGPYAAAVVLSPNDNCGPGEPPGFQSHILAFDLLRPVGGPHAGQPGFHYLPVYLSLDATPYVEPLLPTCVVDEGRNHYERLTGRGHWERRLAQYPAKR